MNERLNETQLINQVVDDIRKNYPNLKISPRIIKQVIRVFFKNVKTDICRGATVILTGIAKFEIVEKKASKPRVSYINGCLKTYKPSKLRLKTTPSASLRRRINQLGRF